MSEVTEKASKVEIEIDIDALAEAGIKSISDLATNTHHNVLFTISQQTAVLSGSNNLKVNTQAFGHIQIENDLGEVIMAPQHRVVKNVKVDGVEVWKK